MNDEKKSWKEIKKEFSRSDEYNHNEPRSTLILGNGASIKFHEKFNYDKLLETAKEDGLLDQLSLRLFESYKNDDFEIQLRRLLRAKEIADCLDFCCKETKKIDDCYTKIKDALIQSVSSIHPEQACISGYNNLGKLMGDFDTVLSLNYDLIVYWAIMECNKNDEELIFKDCFCENNSFRYDWVTLRERIYNQIKVTLVFYPHGNLFLISDNNNLEKKITYSNGEKIIDKLEKEWETSTPLFVSEGTSLWKEKSIKSSAYLNIVNNQVISSLKGNVVIYGSSLKDTHIFEKIDQSKNIDKIAISVFENDRCFVNNPQEVFKNKKDKLTFFDSESVWD